MPEILVLNIVIILGVTILAGLFAPDGERGWAAWFGFVISFNISIICWVIYVAHHFITKYW